VRLFAVPVRLHLANLAHLRDLVHELRIVQAGRQTGGTVGAELGDVIDAVLGEYAGATDATEEQAEAALRAGAERFDIEIDLPPAAAEASRSLLGLLERADELCRGEQLLTLAAPPEIARLRRWMNDQIVAQLEGEASPEPFPD
jgi:hypothetical protein